LLAALERNAGHHDGGRLAAVVEDWFAPSFDARTELERRFRRARRRPPARRLPGDPNHLEKARARTEDARAAPEGNARFTRGPRSD